jgi:peroxiredoxin
MEAAPPAVGQPAPDFTLPRTPEGTLALRDLRGRAVLLAFYVFDFSPG